MTPLLNLAGEFRVVHGELLGVPDDVIGREVDILSFHELNGGLKLSEPDLWPRQVNQYAALPVVHDVLDDSPVLLLRAVAHVDAGHVHACLDHCVHCLWVAGCWPDGANYLAANEGECHCIIKNRGVY